MFKIGLSYFDLSTVTDWSKSVIYREDGEGGGELKLDHNLWPGKY